MKSQWTGSLTLLIALMLAFPAVVSAQTDLHVTGSGSVDTSCLVTLTENCTITATGSMSGAGINPGTFTLRIDTGSPHTLNGYPGWPSQGFCIPASMQGTLAETGGDTLQFNHVGLVCEEGMPGSDYQYNGTFRITGGTGRFSTATGTGNIVGTFTRDAANRALLDIRGAIQ